MKTTNFSSLESHFADFLLRLSGHPGPELALAARLVARQMGQGHICLDLEEFAGRRVLLAEGQEVVCPELGCWVDGLRKCGVVGAPGEWQPLIVDPPFLYLQLYWQYEREVADCILAHSRMEQQEYDAEKVEKNLSRLFPRADGAESDEPDWQKEAARKALASRFCVISGGPGTGKTTTVARILALYLQLSGDDAAGRIFLAAPTGKAAARLQEAIRYAKMGLDCAPELKAAIPETAVTLHRLLGITQKGRRYDGKNLLPARLVVVDEASMVDLPLMAWLMTAIPADCTLILLGDRNQLSSVQPGAVLGDICQGLRDGSIHQSLAELHRSYRFASFSGIGKLSRAVNSGDGAGALAVLMDDGYKDVRWLDMAGDVSGFQQRIVDKIAQHHNRIMHAASPEEALRRMGEFAVLAALRRGPFGVEGINRLASDLLAPPDALYFHGRPIMVRRNHYGLQLYNGDTGLILPDAEADDELRVFFPAESGVRKLLPARLPEHETAFALTVHKSQGSEFDHVVLILPAESSPVLSRELVYTGITRAVQSVEIWGTKSVFVEAVSSRTSRKSGLVRALVQG
ncbi:MAG: exodeoxyribonuclease V subunit alpha [Proteobacteria bacterium]|nr:exodeoxyribonuclease V subunit alpha [Pseudomonadota bacterium]MBU4295256.1 exodeoxyribonuclease V subunit alpha [Pseudomonadota bacterium]MCG2750192.1 exodeoxyribonuclease V subunit alpha [Desulfobulbaceae bacterium]